MNKSLFIIGSSFAFIAVVLGAMGAHLLESSLNANQLASFETGIRYQLYHALVLLFIGVVDLPNKQKRWLGIGFSSGIVLFSFSIYLLATNDLTSINFKRIALITPTGGTVLIATWVKMIIGFIELKRK
ncbi:MAG: DUF423 domain-containing protein [Bacteroidota bacterium]